MIGRVLINGEVSDGSVPVTDSSVLRGDGCFEALRSYGGVVFALKEHLDRLDRSASALGIGLPSRSDLEHWITSTAAEFGDCVVRIVVTRGAAVPGADHPSQVIVFGHPWTTPNGGARLFPVVAPWHAAGVDWDLAGAKIISYAPNLAATRRAQTEGFEDALLMTVDSLILEGPTFTVAWVVDGVLETPTLELGILDSITRRVVLEEAKDLGIDVVEAAWEIDRIDDASEMMAMSTIREVQPVVSIGDVFFERGEITARLGEAFRTRVSG